MIDLSSIAPGLRREPEGYWTAGLHEAVSYPAEGSDFCFSVEDASFWFSHRNRVIAEALRTFPPAAGPLFDVGAGNGFVAAGLQKAGFEVIAIEPSRAGAANAVRRGVDPVVWGTAESAGFLDRSAGAIGLFDVVEHIEDDRQFLRGVARYVRPQGRVYITVPAFPSLWSDDDVQAGHFRRYTIESLATLVEGSGLAVEYATCFFSILPLPIWLFRVIPSRLRRSEHPKEPSHAVGGVATRGLLERALAFEVACVRRRMRIAVGGSCLVVARVC
jgi:SAM-dependent methyltransferase